MQRSRSGRNAVRQRLQDRMHVHRLDNVFVEMTASSAMPCMATDGGSLPSEIEVEPTANAGRRRITGTIHAPPCVRARRSIGPRIAEGIQQEQLHETYRIR